jgi:hypothetical protein
MDEWLVENNKLQKELYLERKNNFIRWSGQFSANSSIYDEEEFIGGHTFRPYTPNVPALRFPNDPGRVYLLVHGTDRLVKIGLTRRSAEARMADYIKKKDLRGEWHLAEEWETDDVTLCEKLIHKNLEKYQVSGNATELFCCSEAEAIVAIEEVIEKHN